MTDIRLDREALALFELMLEAQPADREAWLAGRTAGQPELLSRVRALIVAEARGALATGGAVDGVDEGPAPDRVGSYRVGERIGAGGMGSVFLGERERGDFAHIAAIKIIKPGLLSEKLVSRFQRERQILAQLRHPNIAQLFDGGETDDGSPYIIMEYVQGRSLLAWADETNATRGERLDKLLQACSAVGFAHANLIVHRDITPSNVLVTESGLVKLIDFGIARPAGDASDHVAHVSGESSLHTLSLTPGYAAPERMTGAEPTTAADIYSLGKLAEKLFADRVGDRELLSIVKRATAAAPADRYATVQALSDDLAAWRDDRPVRAHAGGADYVFTKFIARHKRAAATVAAGVVVLVGAFAVTGVSWVRAEQAHDAEAARFEEVRALASYMLFDLNEQLRRVPGNTAARADLAAQAQSYLDTLSRSPRASRELMLETAQGYARLAELQGSPLTRNLGESEDALANIAAARTLLDQAADDAGVDVLAARLDAMEGMIRVLNSGDSGAGTALIVRARDAIEAIPEEARDETWRLAARDIGRGWLEVLANDGDMAELQIAALAYGARVSGWSDVWAPNELAIADYYAGIAQSYPVDDVAAYALFQRAYEALRASEARSSNDPDLLYFKSWAAAEAYAAAARMGREMEAEAMLADGVEAARRLAAIADGDSSAAVLNVSIGETYAQHLSNTGRHREALAEQRRIVDVRREGLDDVSGDAGGANLAWNEMILGLIARRAGDRELTCASWTLANNRFSRVEREGRLLEFHAGFLPGLRSNVALCEAGRPLREFGSLR